MTRKPSEILVATSNEAKTKEMSLALSDLPLKILKLGDFPVRLVEEVGETYEENAIAKAVSYAAQTGIFAIADDSGLEVNALHGGPGFLSARYGGTNLTEAERNQELLTSIRHTPNSGRGARFVSIMALAEPSNEDSTTVSVLCITKGICEGTIAFSSRGDHGFGYDSIFIPEGYKETFGELSDSIKNRISHRAQSMFQMRRFLKDLLTLT